MKLGPEFDEFVRSSSTDLLRLATLLTQDREDAEELLQVALLRTARRWSVARDAPFPYARRVLINLSKNRWRDKSRRPRTISSEGIVLPETLSYEDAGARHICDQEQMSELISRLPLGQRKVLILRYYEDLSIAETAAILRCSEGTIKSQLSRAIATLRSELGRQGSPSTEDQKC